MVTAGMVLITLRTRPFQLITLDNQFSYFCKVGIPENLLSLTTNLSSRVTKMNIIFNKIRSGNRMAFLCLI